MRIQHIIYKCFISLLVCIAAAPSQDVCAQHVGMQKLSSYVRRTATEYQHTMRKAKGTADNRAMTALVRCTDTDVLTANGCRILASFDNNIYIATIPLRRINTLAAHSAVKRIETSERCSLHNDTTRIIVEAPQTPKGEFSCGGAGVIIGIEDVGFDLTHPTFYSSDGSRYRIKRLWDMLDTLNITPSLPVGGEYTTEADILTKAHSTDNYIVTHGTHTSGTAAGSGFTGHAPSISGRAGEGASYAGMAPDADIVLVSNAVSSNMNLIPENKRELYNTSLDLLGFKYIFDYADSVRKPCVINFSEGSHQDFYEHTLYDEVIGQLVGPGRIIVSSAGNEGQKLTYLSPFHPTPDREGASSLYYNDNNSAFLTFRSQGDINFTITFDALGSEPVNYNVHYKDTTSVIDTICAGDAIYAMEYYVYPNCYDTLHLAGEIFIKDLTHKSIGSSQQRLAFTIPYYTIDESTNLPNTTEIFYYAGQFITRDEYPSDADNTHSINFPSASEHVICVGMTGYRPGFTNYLGEPKGTEPVIPGEINRYSSVGPALSGLNKPDIYAPGVNIISSFSSYYLENNADAYNVTLDVEHFDFNGRTYAWNSDSGTSMSAPVVTGVIALWLEYCPTLTREQIMETFRATTGENSADGRTLDINYRTGLNYIKEHFIEAGIHEVAATPEGNSHLDSSSCLYDLTGRRLPLTDRKRGIYIVNGRKIAF